MFGPVSLFDAAPGRRSALWPPPAPREGAARPAPGGPSPRVAPPPSAAPPRPAPSAVGTGRQP